VGREEGEAGIVITRIVKVLIAVCLIVWTAFTALWIRSYFADDKLYFTNAVDGDSVSPRRGILVDSLPGRVLIYLFRISAMANAAHPPIRWHSKVEHGPDLSAGITLDEAIAGTDGMARWGFGLPRDLEIG
jgi:hypothetical protein